MTYQYPTAFNHWGAEEYTAIHRVIASQQFTMGSEVKAFEDEFAAYHGRKHCIMVNSGSSANLIAVTAMNNGPNTVAVLPALAWATTYAPFLQRKIPIGLCDCDDTWNTPACASVGVPVLGNPRSIPSSLEDCCESIGARDVSGQLCGTFGVLSTFSFFYSHQLSAIEGGAILTDQDCLAATCRMLRNHGWTRGVEETKSFADEYKFALPGYNVRPLEMHAAIARAQLRKVDAHAVERRKNWNAFEDMSRGLDIKLQEITSPEGFNPFCIAFTVPSSEIRETIAQALRLNGVDCRPVIGGSFRKQPYGKDYDGPPTPNADRIHDTGLMLGNAPFDISDKIKNAITIMRGYV